MDSLILLLPIVLICATIILTLYLIRLIQQQSPQPRRQSATYQARRRKSAQPYRVRTLQQTQPIYLEAKLEAKLVSLVRDKATAQRLVAYIRQNNPGRNEEWCWQKAIRDIERDRR